MLYLLYTLHVIVCLFLILVVLLQQGKGADLSVFGGGGTQAAFGPRGATTLLHKLTVWGFVAFTVMTISIGFLTGRGRGGSVMQGVETEQSAPANPEPAAAEPATPVAEPEPGAAESRSRAPEPEATTAEPEITTAEPEATTPDDGSAAAAETDSETTPATEDAAPAPDEGEPESAPDDPPR